MILAACYTVYNGLELLYQSVNNIRPQVDIIIVCYQKKSNTGSEKPSIFTELSELLLNFNIVFVEFTPNDLENTKGNERKKHNLMLETARKEGASHFILMACDHFYKESEVIFAKKEVILNDYDVTLTNMFTYYKRPEYQLEQIETYSMPFICKLYEETRIERVRDFPVYVDPSVQITTFRNWKLFSREEIMMHHYSMIRKDIREKFKNAAASIRWTPEMVSRFIFEYENFNIDTPISYFQNSKVREVENFFNL